jgi:hypothetical protein
MNSFEKFEWLFVTTVYLFVFVCVVDFLIILNHRECLLWLLALFMFFNNRAVNLHYLLRRKDRLNQPAAQKGGNDD